MTEPSNPQGSTTPPGRVLVVDDVPQNLQVVGTILRQAGYHVMPAASGAQALERVRARTPDLILLDLMMPDMDGLEVCRRLKADPGLARLPVIFLTASNEMEHLVSGFAAGAVDYITKPFNAPELLARVRTHLDLKRAEERLRELNDEKNELMGIVAHDLRNPLGAILGYAEFLLEEPGMDPAEIGETLGRVRATARRMIDMVAELLDANAIERGDLKPCLAEVEAVGLARAVVESFQSRAIAKGQSLLFEGASIPCHARADAGILARVLENLVSNAIKFSPPDRRIWVRVETEANAVQWVVQDEGPGLSAEDRARLFGKFARLGPRPTAGEQSTGLGLAIVKRMVEAMSGRVWCESEAGLGARFIVRLPITQPAPQAG